MPPAAPVPAVASDGLFQTLLQVSLTGVILFRPVFGPGPARLVDWAYVQLNPAAQRMLRLPECPTETFLTLYPSAVDTDIMAFYRDTFEAGTAGRYDVNYQHDGLDNYYHLAAQRHGELLVVSFTDTAEQPRTAVEVALREAQAAEQQARAEAQREREELARLFEQAPVALAVFEGPRYRVQLANPAVLRMWGRTPAQALHTPLFELLPEIVGEGFEELLDQVVATGTPHVAHEMPSTIDRGGRRDTVYWDFVYQPRREADGRVTGVTVVASEVTEQVLARQQLQQLNEELETRVQARTREALALQADLLATAQRRVREREEFYQVFEQTAALVALLRTPGHRFEYVNPAFRAIFSGRQLVGRTLAEAAPDMVEQGFGALLDRVFQTGETFFGTELPFAAAVPAGQAPRTAYYNFTYQAYREADEIVGVSIFAYDVTEQVLARRDREVQRQRLLGLFQEAPAGICILAGPALVFEFVNPGYQRLLPGRALLGRSVFEVLSEIVGTPVETMLRQVFATGRTHEEQDLLIPVARPADGVLENRYFTFLYQGRRDEQGQVDGILVFAFEVTEQVEARRQVEGLNQELAAANTQLTRTNVDLDNFIYTASHDLKAPITNIEGLLDTLRHELPEQPPTGEVAYILDLMQESVERFQRTIEHLTAVSKLQKEHDPPVAQVALAPVLEDVRQDLAPLLRQTGGRLHLRVAACPPLRFAEKNLRSVLYNLLSNALKYRHPNRVPEVRVRCHQADGFTVLEVQDNGLGLDLAHETQLFAMFQRLHTHVEGSGLGLYMVKRIMENAGGNITVQSRVGEGTTFSIYFPH